ncbi:MAG: CoB--CoM heterodisulfide reductase iron-sulfur subunit B family protein [Chloroflexota bacterium]|nr:CoB--CoM heterodisulfide reductase iron-sulfur subunit B family protein [Chloroflexota bacterium]
MVERVYAYYPGCSLHATAKEYDVSTRLVCRSLGLQLKELEDWTCCGASSAHASSHLLGVALPARNLALARQTGLPLAVPCAMCFSRLRIAQHELEDSSTREAVSRVLGQELQDGVAVLPLLKVLAEEPLEVKRPLKGLKVACYYGCLLVRPRKVMDLDDEDNPQLMDRLVERLGAEPLDWGLKTDCCGAGLPLARPDIVHRLSHRLLARAKAQGAQAMAVACPMCHSNLDMHQRDLEKEYGDKLGLPVFYFTQLMGLALGYSPKELMLDRHHTDPIPLLRRLEV